MGVLPPLTLVLDEEPPAHVPDACDPSVELWWDRTGAVRAMAQPARGRHWMRVTGVATFSFDDRAREVLAVPDPGVAREAVETAYRDMVRPVALQALGLELLHASAVITPQGVIVLCGCSGTGKSTFAFALAKMPAHSLWADDLTLLDLRGTLLEAVALPFDIGLRPASVSYFRDVESSPPRKARESRAPLRAICILRRVDPAGPLHVTRLTASAAFSQLMDYAHSFCTEVVERRRRMLRGYMELVARVPVLEVRFRPGFDAFPAVLDGLMSRVGDETHAQCDRPQPAVESSIAQLEAT